MTCHGYGYGFYEPESTKDVRPGLCGYIDDSGRWQTIVDLAHPAAISQKGYSAFSYNDKMQTTRRRWGPKTSSSVIQKETRIDASVSGASASVPVNASILWTYSHSSNFGAILLCPEDITNEGYRQKSPFRSWATSNAKSLFKNCPDVKEHGFFIITSTWHTTEAFTTAWSNPTNQVQIGVKVGAACVGEAGQSFEYYRADAAGSWIEADVKGGRKNVVFFGGLYFKYRPLYLKPKEIAQKYWESRAADSAQKTIFSDPEDEKAVYMVETSEVGDLDVEEGEDNED